jgi:formylglycine-generating enzyme required for sulfatase activity/predicted Ser/Thr protein kinase
MGFEAGQNVGRYEVICALGAGGMGEVYRARDVRLERDVAIKVLRPVLLKSEDARKQFHKEALALARLNHPNIAGVYDVGEFDGTDYLVMEYVAGKSLAGHLREGPMATERALTIAAEIAAALAEAHEQGVVHRDVKPSNVAITEKGHAKVLDFGLAKLLAPSATADATVSMTEMRGPMGTLQYMSPEQAEGKFIDSRTDLWSLGVLLYETLSGQPPFRGNSALAILKAVTAATPQPLREVRKEIPEHTEHIVAKALEKDVTKRYQKASEMESELTAALRKMRQPEAERPSSRWTRTIVAGLAVVVLLAIGAGFYWRMEKRQWVHEEAVSDIAKRKADHRPLAAFLLFQKANRYLPDDPQLLLAAEGLTEKTSVTSAPDGATVEIQDYLEPNGPWYRVGTTPLQDITIPNGYFRWKIAKKGVGEMVTAPDTTKQMTFPLEAALHAPKGRVPVSGGEWSPFLSFVGWAGPYQLKTFFMDRYEVTNTEFQKFVDAGGYEKQEYWREPFVEKGRGLSWKQAMELFRDGTGRHGPSTWKAGHFPEGQEKYPVSGVSWYEASAYAAFMGKSLPTFSQWYQATSEDASFYAVAMANISKSALAPAGSFPDVGVYGTHDMAGNVREWVINSIGDLRFILGGAWNEQTYHYSEPDALDPLDRNVGNGLRCVENTQPVSAAELAPIKGISRDFTKAKPLSDEVFNAYQSSFSYPQTPLNAREDGTVEETADWRKEKVSFDAAYGGEWITAYLFLPKKVPPPYQVIVFSPSARVLDIADSANLGDEQFFDFIVQSGRAVMYPVYQGTYERDKLPPWPWTLELASDQFKDLSRSVDYLDTRKNIDAKRLAYVGVSMGAARGVDYVALMHDRIRTAIFLDGGFFLDVLPPAVDQVNYAPRLRIPVLMVNGRYDFSFSLESAQNPRFAMLGTPAADKKHVVMESSHDVTVQREQMVKVCWNGWISTWGR